MLNIELRGVASSQKFEENRQSVKNDDVVWHFVYVRSVLWRISDLLGKWFPLQGERAQSLKTFNVSMLVSKTK